MAALVGVSSFAGREPEAPPHLTIKTDAREAIEKARALALEKKRERACALLVRAISKEPKASIERRELTKSLDDLSEVFFSEQGQAAWSAAESVIGSKPREAIDSYQSALKIEDENVAALNGLARAHLLVGECDRAVVAIKRSEAINPFSPETRLLRLQALDCDHAYEQFDALLASRDVDLAPVETFLKTLQAKELLRKRDFKRAKTLVAQWEQAAPDYPEVYFWRWKLADAAEQTDRTAAIRYAQSCRNLSPRRRKAFRLDFELCKGLDVVDAYLKSAGLQPSTLSDQPPSAGGTSHE